MNENLTEAIALGHDLGHTPFGHSGEHVLNRLCPDGFIHCEQSVRVVEVLEKKGQGLNLTWEVRDGIRNHRTSGHPATLEGRCVQLADKIAYINHDIDDAMRSGVIGMKDIPKPSLELFGRTHRERINNMVVDVIRNSDGKEKIYQSEPFKKELDSLRTFMFENVYKSSRVKREEDLAKVEVVLSSLYDYFLQNVQQLPEDLKKIAQEDGAEEAVKDYVAGMTDRFALNTYTELFVPKAWK